MNIKQIFSLALCLSFAAAGSAQVPPPDPDDAIVVHGYPPHCHPRADDPQDAVDLAPAAEHATQQVIRIDPATGKFGLFPDDYPTTDPLVWQRDGTRIDQYVFRVPTDDTPVCVGSRTRSASGFAQLRRAVDARPYWGKVMRFTALVATRQAADVRFWVAGGAGRYRAGRHVKVGSNIVVGGVQQQPLTGNLEWTPVSFTIGPIPCMATQISYGVTLQGRGDVWLYQAGFEEVPDAQLSPAVSARPRGTAYLGEDPICRHFLRGEDLYAQGEKPNLVMSRLTDDDDIVPGVTLYTKANPTEVGTDPIHKRPGRNFVPVPSEKYFAPGLNN